MIRVYRIQPEWRMNKKCGACRPAALTFAPESGMHHGMMFVASALCTDGDARADLRLTQIANPLKRAFHSKPDVELSITLGHLLALV